MNHPRLCASLWLLLMMLSGLAVAQQLQVVPTLSERVTDQVGILTAEQKAALVEKLARLEQSTGSQVAVLIIATTAPEDIAAYSIRVVDKWRLGRETIDDGVLFLVASEDRRMRLEVGYGLEGAIPDARAKRIIDTLVAPQFRTGDYAAGINAGVDAIASQVRGEELPPPTRGNAATPDDVFAMLPVVLVVALILGGILRHILGAVPGALTTGGLVGLVAWFMVGLIGAAIVVGFLAFVVSLVNGAGSGAWSNRGGYGGGFGGGSFGGGGFGGGGFGGGGGGFGGGGASGGW